MASELAMVNKDFREAGTVRDFYGDPVVVSVSPDGDVLIVITMEDEDDPRSLSAVLDPSRRDELRELLDRAAMPGQPLPEAAPTQAEVDRCGYSEDPYHRCRACYDYAAGREREHPLTVAAVDPAAMEVLGQLADAAQEAGDE